VVADPGATASFDITVTTDTPQRVDLTVVQQPEGWTTSLRGGGSTVSAVYTASNPDSPTQIIAAVTAEVAIPEDAAAGNNQVVIEGRSAAGTTVQLTLDLTIEQIEPGAVSMTSEFPTQSGSADESFTFDLEVRNDTNQQITLSFEGEGPAGWRVDARPGGDTSATTAVVDAGGLSSATVTIDPAANAAAGTYPIVVRALGGPQPVETELGVEITGSYAMSMSTSDQRLSANLTVGSSTSINVVVFNDGSAPLENVQMEETPPREWTVTFDREVIESIAPGSSETVAATIQSAGNAVAGDYVVTIRASNDEVNDSIEIRTTVESSPIGGLIGIGILVIVGVGLFFVFQRYGRR
jgi:uncharacterized membrane protein